MIIIGIFRHRGPAEWWSKNATVEDWFDEMVGQANIINRFAKVRMEDFRYYLIATDIDTVITASYTHVWPSK